MSYWMSLGADGLPSGTLYQGDMITGDRAATDAEIAAWQAAHPAPPTSVAVQSTGTPALNGTYAIDAATTAKINAVVSYIAEKSAFPDALSPFPWPDASGALHNFPTTASFIAFAEAIADYVTAITLGQSPTTPLTIP